MPGPLISERRPNWQRPETASVMDSPMVKALRILAKVGGIDSMEGQVGALMSPMGVPDAGGLEGGVMGAVQRLIKAYHGSPYDFDKFDMSKIGTGEGAQAYGHGLYFAENPETALAYRSGVGGARKFGEVAFDALGGGDAVMLNGRQWTRDDMIRAFNSGELGPDSLPKPLADSVTKAIGAVPRTYEVAIKADPEQFLDWDAPAANQPENVKQAIGKLWQEKGGVLEGREHPPFTAHSDATGNSIYSAIATTFGGEGNDRALQQAGSEALKKAGVPGIKYLDQGSRGAGEGTRNYVVFDDQLIEILRKYGLLAPAAAPALSRMMPPQPSHQEH